MRFINLLAVYSKALLLFQAELERNVTMLREKEQELDKALSRLDEQEPLDVDEAVTTTAPLYKQSVSHHLPLAYLSLVFFEVYKNADFTIYKISLTGGGQFKNPLSGGVPIL